MSDTATIEKDLKATAGVIDQVTMVDTDAVQEQRAAHEAQDNKTLNEILGIDPQGGGDNTHGSDDPKVGGSGTNEDTTVSQEGGTDGTTTEPDKPLDGYDKAIAALKRINTPQEVIDLYADKPEALVAWGLGLAKNQADVDGFGTRIKELESKLDPDASETKDGDSKTPTGVQLLDPESLTRSESVIAEMLGDEVAKAVLAPVREMQEKLSQAMNQQGQQYDNLQATEEERGLAQARSKLGERFTRLSNDDDFGRVRERMEVLVQTGHYNDYETLMTDAYRLECPDDAAKTAKRQERNALKDTGQPTTTTAAKTPATSKTLDQREDDALDKILDGEGSIEAAKAYGGG